MSAIQRPFAYMLGTLVMGLVGLLLATTAESRSPTCSDSLRDSSRRVAQLEAEVQALREQLNASAHCQGNAPSKLARSASRPLSHVGRVRSSLSRSQADSCDPPFSFDADGIKFYNPECMRQDVSAPCAIPYGITSSGIKYYEASCLDVTPSRGACDPAFDIDASGMKRYKPECL